MTPETYSDVFDLLEREHVRYVVIGGAAVVLRGYVRPIADLDFVVERINDEMNRAMSALNALGFVPTIPLPLSALTVLRMFDPSQREVNVFVRSYIPFAELWADSERVRISHSLARVASLEHLLRAMRVDRRPHNLLDIRGLLALEAGSRGRSNGTSAAVGEQDESGEEAV